MERLVALMAEGWRDGRQPLVEEFLERNPALRDDPDAAVRLIYEEICLRKEAGQVNASAEVKRRFPQWREELALLLECAHLIDGDPRPILPEVGEQLGEFQLLAELGRGACGRVFLASQPSLADRFLVLKVASHSGRERESLARLQHAHIVPLYFAQDFPARRLQVLGMPYLGGLTLAALYKALAAKPPGDRTGRDILDVLQEQGRSAAPVTIPLREPIRRFLENATYSQAVCWMAACLAEALHHAHEGGLVHLDVKPSNVLLAADGQPMLLDFHLAQPPLSPTEAAPVQVGGTPEYMPPEQLEAFAAIREGRPVALAVDGRADIYALGALMYEALCGALPRPGANPRRMLGRNPQVSRGLADLIGKCLAPASCRYANAAVLASDLRRHIADLPLRGVGNTSLVESWKKWRRRRPHAVAVFLLFLAVGVGTAAAAWGTLADAQRRVREAEADLAEGRRQLQDRQYGAALRSLTRGTAAVDRLPGQGRLADDLRLEIRRAQRGEAADAVHGLTEALLLMYGTDRPPRIETARLDDQSRTLWESRDLLADRAAPLDEAMEERVRLDAVDFVVLWSDLAVRSRTQDGGAEARRQALDRLREAEDLFGPDPILRREQASLRKALGWKATEDEAAERLTPRTAWEFCALGRSLFRDGELEAASAAFDRALALDPSAFWASFFQGLCQYRLQRYSAAVMHFHACVALAPTNAKCFYNRALAYAAGGQTEQAIRDYDRALQLEPEFAQAALNRGLLHLQEKEYPEAVADVERALQNGIDPAVGRYSLALVHLARGDRGSALRSVEGALREDPDCQEAKALYSALTSE